MLSVHPPMILYCTVYKRTGSHTALAPPSLQNFYPRRSAASSLNAVFHFSPPPPLTTGTRRTTASNDDLIAAMLGAYHHLGRNALAAADIGPPSAAMHHVSHWVSLLRHHGIVPCRSSPPRLQIGASRPHPLTALLGQCRRTCLDLSTLAHHTLHQS